MLVASQDVPTKVLDTFNGLLPAGIEALPNASALVTGATASATLDFGGQPRSLNGAGDGRDGNRLRSPPRLRRPDGGHHLDRAGNWFNVQKTFGPVFFNRVGLKYESGSLLFLLDASLTAAGLTLSLDGLALRLAARATSSRTFDLKGSASITPTVPSRSADRSFARRCDGPDDEQDELRRVRRAAVLIRTQDLTLSACGSYA